MPKLKRVGDADNRGATDFIESLDRGLRVLEVFGGSHQPMTLSDLAKAEITQDGETRRLTTSEAADFANLVVSAGSETVARLLGWLDRQRSQAAATRVLTNSGFGSGMADGSAENIIDTWPATRSCTAGAAPR